MSQDSSNTGTSPPAPPGSSVPESGAGNNNDKDSPVAPSPDSTLPSPPPPSDNSNKQPSSPSSDKKSAEAPPPPEAPTQENKSPPLPPPSTSEAPPVPQTPKQQTPEPPQTQSSPQQQSQPAPDSRYKKLPPSTLSSSSSESSSADSSPSSSSSTTTSPSSSSSDSNAGSDSSDHSTETSPSPPSPSSSPGTPPTPSSSNSTSSSSSSSLSSSTSSAPANGFSTPSSSTSPKALDPPTPTTYKTPNPNSNDGSSGSGSSNNNTQSNVSSSNSHAKPPSNQSAVAVTVVVGVLVVVIIVMFFYLRGRKKKQQDSNAGSNMPPPANYTMILDAQPGESPGNNAVHGQPCTTVNSPQRGPDLGIMAGPKTFFTYEEVIEMTDGFSSRNVIGEGGFGCVYKGRMPDGRVVAVKQLKSDGGQGDREFRAEVEIISRVHHKHLVSLVGYSTSENQRLLIYEFVPNKTLEHHLHGKDLPVLEWTKRVKIALGAAKGLAYLHEDCHPKIIHRDIKSANILLEDNFEAKVADFGLARLNDATQSQTHVSTRVMGTFGYLAPEYASSGKLTDRSDVYSFGVVLLELITGRKPVDSTSPLGDESLVEWARPLLIQALETGDYGELIDSRLENRYEEREIIRMIEAAAACVRHSFSKRPHMALVVRSLDFEGDPDLSNGVKYGDSTAYDSGKYSEEIMQFRQMAFSSTENSSELYNSRGVSGGGQSSWNSQYSSGDYTSGELETRTLRPDSGEYRGTSRNHKTTARFS